MVFGLVVRSRGLGGNIMAGLRSIGGGEIHEYTELLEDTRRQAIDRLVQNATLMGGNAVISMRFDSSELASTMSEIVAYGTAVVVGAATTSPTSRSSRRRAARRSGGLRTRSQRGHGRRGDRSRVLMRPARSRSVEPACDGGVFGGLWLVVTGRVFFAAVAFERFRYRSLARRSRRLDRPGPGGGETVDATMEPRFRRTDERLRGPDEPSRMRVWLDPAPASGATARRSEHRTAWCTIDRAVHLGVPILGPRVRRHRAVRRPWSHPPPA